MEYVDEISLDLDYITVNFSCQPLVYPAWLKNQSTFVNLIIQGYRCEYMLRNLLELRDIRKNLKHYSPGIDKKEKVRFISIIVSPAIGVDLRLTFSY